MYNKLASGRHTKQSCLIYIGESRTVRSIPGNRESFRAFKKCCLFRLANGRALMLIIFIGSSKERTSVMRIFALCVSVDWRHSSPIITPGIREKSKLTRCRPLPSWRCRRRRRASSAAHSTRSQCHWLFESSINR